MSHPLPPPLAHRACANTAWVKNIWTHAPRKLDLWLALLLFVLPRLLLRVLLLLRLLLLPLRLLLLLFS